jgi:hypothetical protein
VLRTARTARSTSGGYLATAAPYTVTVTVPMGTYKRMGHNGLHAGGMYWRGYSITIYQHSLLAVRKAPTQAINRPENRFYRRANERKQKVLSGDPSGAPFVFCSSTQGGYFYSAWPSHRNKRLVSRGLARFGSTGTGSGYSVI